MKSSHTCSPLDCLETEVTVISHMPLILTDSMSLQQKVEWEAQIDWHVSLFNVVTFEKSYGCTVLDTAGVTDRLEMRTEQKDWRAKQPSQVECVSEDLKC